MKPLKKILNPIKHFFLLLLNFAYDFIRYVKASSYITFFKSKNREQLICGILKTSHAIEKGLSFRTPKQGFGVDKIKYLLQDIRSYIDQYEADHYIIYTLKVLQSYYQIHADFIPGKIKTAIAELLTKYETPLSGTSIKGGVATISNTASNTLSNLITARVSVRDFSEEDVDLTAIDQAISIAQKAPSACNRQSVKVYVATGKEKIKELLSYQNGNKGFGENINKLIILTADLNYYGSVAERHLGYIDCGIFSMSLLLSLNSYGISSCPLNWSNNYKTDTGLRKAAKIPSNEIVGLLIGVGYAAGNSKIPISWRKPLEDVRYYVG
jgi:nitroreductase